jgi:hypothetical protein
VAAEADKKLAMMLKMMMMKMMETLNMVIDQLKGEERLEETKIFGYCIYYLRQDLFFGK